MNGILMMESLVQVPWPALGRTYGNPEASLTGAIVGWWIGLAPGNNEVLEGGFTLSRTRGKKKQKAATPSAQCDLLLCLRGEPIGAVEIESSKPLAAIERLETLLSSEMEELRSLRFVMAVLHTYEPAGRGDARDIPSPAGPEVIEAVTRLSKRYPNKNVVLLRMDKSYERRKEGVRALNELYWGSPELVEGILFREGEEQMRRPYDLTPLHSGETVFA